MWLNPTYIMVEEVTKGNMNNEVFSPKIFGKINKKIEYQWGVGGAISI